MQGKLFQRCTHLLYCSVLGGNVNTRRMSKPDMGSFFHIKNQWNILVIGNYCVNYQIFQNSLLLTSSDTKRTLMHQFNSCLQIPPRVRRVYTTAINFPWITFLYGWDFREDCSEFIQSIFSTTVYRVIHKEWDFREDCSEFIQSIFSTTVYRVIHKEWDFREDSSVVNLFSRFFLLQYTGLSIKNGTSETTVQHFYCLISYM